MVSPSFILAGKAVFTVETTEDWFTFRVTKAQLGGKSPRTAYFVRYMDGSSNLAFKGYVGEVDPESGTLRLTAKSEYDNTDEVFEVARTALDAIWGNAILPDGWEVRHKEKCGRCGRRLTTPESLDRGIGPECWGLVAQRQDVARG